MCLLMLFSVAENKKEVRAAFSVCKLTSLHSEVRMKGLCHGRQFCKGEVKEMLGKSTHTNCQYVDLKHGSHVHLH